MNKYKEQLKKMIELAEQQLKLIKVVTGFSDAHLNPQIKVVTEAKKILAEGD